MTSAGHENGAPLPTQGAAGSPHDYGIMRPASRLLTQVWGQQPFECWSHLNGCVISNGYRILKLRYRQEDLRYRLGMLSKSRDCRYSSTAARVVVHCEPIFLARRRPCRAYVRRECLESPQYAAASCSEISSPIVSGSTLGVCISSYVIALWGRCSAVYQHGLETCSCQPLRSIMPFRNSNTSALNSCGCSIFG